MADRPGLPLSVRAPAKLNLGLRVGPRADDGLHEIRSLFCPLELSDRIVIEAAEADRVVCEDVTGTNLAAAALSALRDAGWDAPPVQVEIEKRIPIAAGLGGGSADAAAVLRLAQGTIGNLGAIAFPLGSDVPSQLRPAPCIVSGRGESVSPVRIAGGAGVVLIPAERELGAGEVYGKADELGLPASDPAVLDGWEADLRAALDAGTPVTELGELLGNDLGAAALALAPEIRGPLDALVAVGARAAFVCGSGPTAAGLFDDLPAADAAAAGLGARYAGALVTALDVAEGV